MVTIAGAYGHFQPCQEWGAWAVGPRRTIFVFDVPSSALRPVPPVPHLSPNTNESRNEREKIFLERRLQANFYMTQTVKTVDNAEMFSDGGILK